MIIGNNCKLERVITMGADFYETEEEKASNREKGIPDVGIGSNTVIRNAIIDKNARIGNNVVIENRRGVQSEEGKNYVIQDGIVVIAKNAIIPDNTVI
jgi:glucose-1-phosphate adenylyltransferase